MALSTKAIKTRIKSVKNTKKITKAMELVSAAKMRRAVDATLGTRLYAGLAHGLMKRLALLNEPNCPLFEKRPVKKILMIVISSNRGLCGSFSSNIIKYGASLLKEKKNLAMHRDDNALENTAPIHDIVVDVFGIGSKSAAFAKRNGLNLVEVYDHLHDRPDIDETIPLSKRVIDMFKDGSYDKVVLVYTHFESSLNQTPKVRQLLPISELDLEKMLSEVSKTKKEEYLYDDTPIDTYILEPSRDVIFEFVIPRLIDIQLYQAVLESSASEHSARMAAMKNASDAAGDMIDALTLAFNKARQAAITQEIAEIAGGTAAQD